MIKFLRPKYGGSSNNNKWMRSGWSVGRQLINQAADKTWQASTGNGERRWLFLSHCVCFARSGRKDSVYVCELRLLALQIKSHLAAARINNVFRVEGAPAARQAIAQRAPIINSAHCSPTVRLLSFGRGRRRELMLNRTLFIRICPSTHTHTYSPMAALLSASEPH